MDVSDARRPKALETEDARFKKLLAEPMLADNSLAGLRVAHELDDIIRLRD